MARLMPADAVEMVIGVERRGRRVAVVDEHLRHRITQAFDLGAVQARRVGAEDRGGRLDQDAGLGLEGDAGDAVVLEREVDRAMQSPQVGLRTVPVACGSSSRPAPAASAARRSRGFL